MSARTEPPPSPAALAAAFDRLEREHAALRDRPVDDILVSLEGVAAAWLRPDSPWRCRAEEALPEATGLSPEMIRHGLPWMIEPLRAPAIAELLAAELGDRDVLDVFVNGRRAAGPKLILHILAGNLPAAAAVPIALGLAVKACVAVKPARAERVFPALFAESIAAVDAELGACVAVPYWSGGDRAYEDQAFARADLVIASGSDDTIADLRARAPRRFIGHGHKVSFAVVPADVLRHTSATHAAAAGLALDVTMWDQRGCLSPQLAFVEGDFDAARAFGEALAPELARFAAALPPGAKTLAEQTAIRRFRDEAEWRRIGGQPAAVLASAGTTDWTIVVEPEPAFHPTPLGRSIRVLPYASLAELAAALAPVRGVLEAAGRPPEGEGATDLDRTLVDAGIHWIAPLGGMQRPPLAWPQGGRPRVGDWVGWTLSD